MRDGPPATSPATQNQEPLKPATPLFCLVTGALDAAPNEPTTRPLLTPDSTKPPTPTPSDTPQRGKVGQDCLKEWRERGHVHENYDAETGMGCGKINSDAFYHWGGLLGLISVLENEGESRS